MEEHVQPKINQQFVSEEDALLFYNKFAQSVGFSVRKDYANKCKVTGKIMSRKYVCGKEGHRLPDPRYSNLQSHRAETRTGCLAFMKIRWDKKVLKYVIFEFSNEHNHPLQPNECAHMLRSHRHISNIHAKHIELASDAGITLKGSFDLAGKMVGGKQNLGYTKVDQKNYLRTRRQHDMVYGELGCIIRYFQDQSMKNPMFFYALQLDCDEQVTNIFWADSRMIMDYMCFGDVVAFDTTFNTNNQLRPFGAFTGFNHHRQMVLFGATLLYDETIDSFKWLFATFLEAHSQNHPRTIFTDQDAAMANAINSILPNTRHGLCSWHINHNAMKNLAAKVIDAKSVLSAFSACMYEYEEEDLFNEKWKEMLDTFGLHGNTWLESMYGIRHKWARCLMSETFNAGIRSTQISESLNASFKRYLERKYNLFEFFHHFERVVNDKRYNELQAEFESRHKLPNIRMNVPMLQQAADVYTNCIFEEFQRQYEEFLMATVKSIKEKEEEDEYTIDEHANARTHVVRVGSTVQSVRCSCRLYETVGILCCHAIKVLDAHNVKTIPAEFIMKRWTKHARDVSLDFQTSKPAVDECNNVNQQLMNRYRRICQNFVKLANVACNTIEGTNLVENEIVRLSEQVKNLVVQPSIPMLDVPQSHIMNNPYENAKGFKKKIGQKGGPKRRKKSFIEATKTRSKRHHNPQEEVFSRPVVSLNVGNIVTMADTQDTMEFVDLLLSGPSQVQTEDDILGDF